MSGRDEISGTMRQQRAHLCAFGARDRHLERVAARPVAAAELDLRGDEQHRQRRRDSAPAARGFRRAPAASRARRAKSPIVFDWRAASSARFTSSRMAISRCQSATSAGSANASSDSRAGNSARCTDSSRVPGQVPPQLVAGHRQDRRQQPRQAVGDHVHRGLRRAALARIPPRTCRADPSTRRRRTPTGRPSSAG